VVPVVLDVGTDNLSLLNDAVDSGLSLDPPPGLSPEACRNSRGAL
jgi:hypothetical protein